MTLVRHNQVSKMVSMISSNGLFRFRYGDYQVRAAVQPVVARSVHGWHRVFHEVLARPMDALGQDVHPATYISGLEETGEVHHFDALMLEAACQRMEGADRMVLSVNVSSRTLANAFPLILKTIGRRPAVARRLIVEVTERRPMTNAGQIRTIIKSFHRLGVRVAFDDVGTDEAGSMEFLAGLRPQTDFIKLDQSVLADRYKLHHLLNIAKRNHIPTIVEGIDDKKTADQLGYQSLLQGYYFGRPSLTTVASTTRPNGMRRPITYWHHPDPIGSPAPRA